MSTSNLFSPVELGSQTLPNRIVMAPMTRLRANGTVPTQLMATYYGSCQLLVSQTEKGDCIKT